MRLANSSRATSFYESFSDLIFCTLIIFLVVILVLMLRVKGRQQELDRTIDSEVALNQFAGGPRETSWCFVLVLDGDTRLVAFVPRDIWQSWSLVRGRGNDPVRLLGDALAGETPRLTMLPIEIFQAIGDGFSLELVQGGMIVPEIGDVVTRMLEARRDGIHAVERLYEAAGGMHAGTHGPDDRPLESGRRGSERYFAFLAGPGAALPDGDPMQFFRQYERLQLPMHDAVMRTGDEPARIRFSVDDRSRRIQLGGAVLSPDDFAGILGSISVGRGFYVEHDGGGADPIEPPSWVIDEVFVPLGLDRRIPSEAAVQSLRRRRRGRRHARFPSSGHRRGRVGAST